MLTSHWNVYGQEKCPSAKNNIMKLSEKMITKTLTQIKLKLKLDSID